MICSCIFLVSRSWFESSFWELLVEFFDRVGAMKDLQLGEIVMIYWNLGYTIQWEIWHWCKFIFWWWMVKVTSWCHGWLLSLWWGVVGSLWFWVLIIFLELHSFVGSHLKLTWIDWYMLMETRETWVRLWDLIFFGIACWDGYSLMRISAERLRSLHLVMNVNPLCIPKRRLSFIVRFYYLVLWAHDNLVSHSWSTL